MIDVVKVYKCKTKAYSYFLIHSGSFFISNRVCFPLNGTPIISVPDQISVCKLHECCANIRLQLQPVRRANGHATHGSPACKAHRNHPKVEATLPFPVQSRTQHASTRPSHPPAPSLQRSPIVKHTASRHRFLYSPIRKPTPPHYLDLPQANDSHITAPLGHDTSPQYPHCSSQPAAYPHYPSAAPHIHRIHLHHVRTLTETPMHRHRIPPALLPSRCGFLSNFIRLSIKGRTGTYINSLVFLGSRLYFTRSLNNSTKLV